MQTAAKLIQFPFAGVVKDKSYRVPYAPGAETAYATPFSLNVVGECPIKERLRGGSRPGLAALAGVTTANDGTWKWPGSNDAILWPDGTKVLFGTDAPIYKLADGKTVVAQHPVYEVKAASGFAPSGSTNTKPAAKYAARLVVADGKVWYASRIGEVTDWNSGADADDAARPAYGSLSLAEAEGETITALMPLGDDYLFAATATTLWLCQGDVLGGFKRVSETVGVVGRNAWCVAGSRLIFASTRGIYAVAPGAEVMVLSTALPEEFKGKSDYTLAYDPERNAVWLRLVDGQAVKHWFFDLENKAFWPLGFAAAVPGEYFLAEIEGVYRLVVKTTTGAWGYFSDEATGDMGAAFASQVAIGPFRTSKRDDMDGMLGELEATLGVGSAAVGMSVFTATSPEGAALTAYNAVNAQGGYSPRYALSAGRNRVIRTRERGAWAVIVLSSTGRWAYESMTVICKMLGRLR